MNRREFLRRLGLTTAGVGLGAFSLPGLRARASLSEAPKRLLVLSHCHGWTYDSWRLTPAGLSASAPWELDLAGLSREALSAPLQPLFDHRQRMLAVDGLSLATAELDVDGNRHDTGWIHSWTGNNADFSGAGTRALSPSLDQLVAAEISRPDRLPSLELSVDDQNEPGRPIAYAPNGVRLPALNSPTSAWDRLFGQGGGDGVVGAQKRVLQWAEEEYMALRPGLSAPGKGRLDAHYDLLNRLGQRLEGLSALECPQIDRPGALNSYDLRFDGFTDLIAAAFACDVTRVITLSLGEMPTADFGWDSLTDDVHKGLAHEIYNDPQKHQAMTDYLTYHSGQVARLLDVLASTPDSDGRTLLDNTLVVWGSELADGWHGYRHYCATLFGGDWAFRPGRYIHMPHETPIEMLVPASVSTAGYSQVSGRPHQHLLVSVAQAMGLSVDQVGLGAVQGQRGDRVECTGPLQELK